MLISKLDKDITRKDNYRWISFQKSSMKYSKSNPAMYKKIYTRTKWDLFHLCKAGSTLNQLYHISRLKRKRINDYINRFRKSTWENSIHIHDKNFQGTGNKTKYIWCNKKKSTKKHYRQHHTQWQNKNSINKLYVSFKIRKKDKHVLSYYPYSTLYWKS